MIRNTLKALALWAALTALFSVLNSSFVASEIIIQAINAALFTAGFYISYYILIRKYLYKGRTSAFIGLYLLVIILLSTISMVLIYQVYVYQQRKFYVENYWNEPVFFTGNLSLMLLVTSSLLSYRFLRDRTATQHLLEQSEKEKISTELDFLKAQINPHFLFNSLNNILFQIDKSNKDARETLLKFSDMLRYQLYECSSDSIAIENEIQYIRNYIGIQLLRKTEKYNCSIFISESVKNFDIAPLLLIPFIENAFKHISNHANRRNSIVIDIDYRNKQFMFSISNDKDNIAAATVTENKGIGLANVKRRLDLLYPGKHDLVIHNLENEYTATLTLQLN